LAKRSCSAGGSCRAVPQPLPRLLSVRFPRTTPLLSPAHPTGTLRSPSSKEHIGTSCATWRARK
jgi:hypothetical protein